MSCEHATDSSTLIAGQCPQCLLGIALEHDDEPRLTPGAMLAERFRLTAFVARGGMGQVYRAIDTKIGQTVAIKFLANDRPSDDAIRLFYDEVRVGRQVAHPSVCRVYDLVESECGPFIVMEFVEGEDLASMLARVGHLPYRRALDIARGICAGLDAAHERGIVHGDLKPANVIIDGDGHARITDFGLARLTREPGRRISGGTRAYMAPEQLAGATASRATDIYALGLVLYELFTGTRPAEDAPRVSARQPRISAETDRMILRCLSRDPRERPSSARDVLTLLGGADSLDAMLLAGETPSPEYVAASRKMRPLRTIETWALLAASIAVLTALLIIAQRSEPRAALSPATLTARARTIAIAAGAAPIADEGSWFEGTLFHYRPSRTPLVPIGLDGRVREDDPPPTEPGMTHVVLTLDGHVVRAAEKRPAATRFADALYTAVLLLAIAVGAVLARRNIRMRRIDGRGAVRLTIWVFVCRAAYGALVAHHPLAQLATIAAAALLMAAEVLIAYLALEPLVRRRWPSLMIGWMRFGQGRIRDAVVGRDILAGIFAGLIAGLIDKARHVGPELTASLREAAGMIIYWHARAIFYALFALFLLLLLRIVVRADLVAALLWIAATTAIFSRGDDVAIVAVEMIVLLLTLRWFGLLALIAAIFAEFVGVGVVGVVVLVFLLALGFFGAKVRND